MCARKFFILSICLATLAAITVCGCAPRASVQSSLNADYDISLSRIFVVLDTQEIDDFTRFVETPGAEFGSGVRDTVTFTSRFVEELDDSFGALGVEYQAYLLSSGELSDSELFDRVAQHGAGHASGVFGQELAQGAHVAVADLA